MRSVVMATRLFAEKNCCNSVTKENTYSEHQLTLNDRNNHVN